MPEGDTILRAANRMRPVLEKVAPDETLTSHPRHARDPDRRTTSWCPGCQR